VDFRVLGTVALDLDGRVTPCRGVKQQLLLVSLLMEPGQVVPTEVLVDRLWGERPPADAGAALCVHVCRLRAFLREAERPGVRGVTLDRGTAGYLLDVRRSAVDVHRFREYLGTGAAPGIPQERRSRLFRAALHLWRGVPLTGLPGEWADRVRTGLYHQRIDAVLGWARAELAEGRASATVGPLAELVEEFPLVEPLAAALLRALSAGGRTAEALERYAAVRRRLDEELGVDPGPELQEVHRDLLRGWSVRPGDPVRY
jgi:DNA-binding SARP family transcriptional activator